ncbi:MAG: CsbD family protein [Gammaproteobacteria bacterium]
MNWDRIEGNWKQFKGRIRAQWGKLTDDHVEMIGGRREELSGKIQEAYGCSKDEAERQIREFETSLDDGTGDSRRL